MELIQTFKKSYFLKMSDDKHLIAQVNSSQINIFENETYRHLAQFKEVGDASVFFSDDSNLLLAKNNDRKLVVYDLATMLENIKSLDPLLYSHLTHQKYIRIK